MKLARKTYEIEDLLFFFSVKECKETRKEGT